MNAVWVMDSVFLVAGLMLLVVGAEALVRGASRLAAACGISPLVIGLTVVAFGTSAPELAVSTVSVWTGQNNIALGNVIGSNIFNILLILGLSALVAPLTVSKRLVRLDVPLMIAASFAVLLFGLDGSIGRLEGGFLFACILIYTFYMIRQSRRDMAAEPGGQDPAVRAAGFSLKTVLLIPAGLGLLVLGSRWMVTGAVSLAERLGVSELVIGLTVVAAGTSLPELATSVVASLRGERDIAVGNVVGSNLFNLLAVLGLTGLAAPAAVPVPGSVLSFDLPIMIATAVACLPVFFTGGEISRWEGALFFAYYIAYTTYLVLRASEHQAAPFFSEAMCWFVIPLTALTLAVITGREILARRIRPGSAGRIAED